MKTKRNKGRLVDYYINAREKDYHSLDEIYVNSIVVNGVQRTVGDSWLESVKNSPVQHIDLIVPDWKHNAEKEHVQINMDVYYERKISSRKYRESILLRGIQNLYKRINFLQLTADLSNCFLTEEEFNEEIEQHENKYVVTFQELRNHYEAQAIHDVVRAIGLDLTINEVAELFGVEPEDLYAIQAQKHSVVQHGSSIHQARLPL